MRQVDVEKLILLSERGNSITYISKDHKWIIKFSDEMVGNTLADYKKKQFLSQVVDFLHINTPKVGDIVCDNKGNLALEYEYIEDKISYARKVSIDPDNVEKYMKDLACFVKKIHNAKVDKNYLLSIEEIVEKTLFANKNIFDEEKIKKVKSIMSKIDHPNTLLHLDLQPGNYIMSSRGTMMIDVDTITCGNPIYDLAFFYYIYHFIQPSHIEKLSRCSVDLADMMWRYFIKYYKNFNTNKEIDDFNEYIKPYAIISAISMLSMIKKEGPKRFVVENFDKYIY